MKKYIHFKCTTDVVFYINSDNIVSENTISDSLVVQLKVGETLLLKLDTRSQIIESVKINDISYLLKCDYSKLSDVLENSFILYDYILYDK